VGEGSRIGPGAIRNHHLVSTRRNLTYGLASQIRRAASSIPSNIAEGCSREGDPELSRFCIIARGSASELDYQLLLARDLKLIQLKEYETPSEQTVEIKRMLTVLIQKLSTERPQVIDSLLEGSDVRWFNS
jgi:four helix bundle protein